VACEACVLTPNPPNSQITNGKVHGVDSCSYLCNAPDYYDIFNTACGLCDTNYAACPVGQYLDACVHNNNTREALARQSECRTCTNLPPLATYTSNGNYYNTSNSCNWTCPTGYHRVGSYETGTCELCNQGPCAVGQYLDGCGDTVGGDFGVKDNECVACTNKDGGAQSEYISNGTFTSMVGNNDCTWRCSLNYFGPSVGSGVVTQAIGGECQPCDMSPCPAGTYRDTCTPGSNANATCVACTDATSPNTFNTLGIATPYDADNCAIICNDGWWLLDSERFCCSDNSYLNSATSCTCSAGFRVGATAVDGADCIP
jgi:hypothetical protein